MRDVIKNILRPFVPAMLLQSWRLKNLSPLIEEINKLRVTEANLDKDGTPRVKLDSGQVFFGLAPTEDEQFIYGIIEKEIDSHLITKDCFGVV